MQSLDLFKQFVDTWLEKAAHYERDRLFGAVDAFWTTFVAYNAVYEQAAARLKIHNPRDREGAKNIVRLLRRAKETDNLRTLIADDAAKVKKVFEEGGFYAHFDRKTGQPDTQTDMQCLERIDVSKQAADVYCLAVLDLIWAWLPCDESTLVTPGHLR